MGFSTWHIQPVATMTGELISTDDPFLYDYLGHIIKLITVGHEYHNDNPTWNKGDNGHMYLEYAGKFAEFENLIG